MKSIKLQVANIAVSNGQRMDEGGKRRYWRGKTPAGRARSALRRNEEPSQNSHNELQLCLQKHSLSIQITNYPDAARATIIRAEFGVSSVIWTRELVL